MNELDKRSRITLPPIEKMALKSIFLSPTMIALLVVSAVSSFLMFSYLVDEMASGFLSFSLQELYTTYGVQALSPAFVIMDLFEIDFLVLLPFLLLVATLLGYSMFSNDSIPDRYNIF